MSPGYSLKRLKLFRPKNSAEPEKLALGEWVEKLRGSKNTDDWLTPCLSSSLTIEEKCYLPEMAQLPYYENEYGVGRLAVTMISSGLWQLGQRVRYEWFRKAYCTNMALRWCRDAVEADILGRWIVQREIHIRQQAHALQKSLRLSSASNTETSSISSRHEEQYKTLEGCEEELRNINREYIKHRRNHWTLQVNVPPGPLQSAFDLTRRSSTWDSLPWLKEGCAGRGGCCAELRLL